MVMERDRNRDVYLNFGLICFGPLREIEKLQDLIRRECENLRVVYQTVTAKRLFLVKKKLRTVDSREVWSWEKRKV
mgnify:CR=1 FL=1